LVLFDGANQTADLQVIDEKFVWCVWHFSKHTKRQAFVIENQVFNCLAFIPYGDDAPLH
jgi:hypothetical protein